MGLPASQYRAYITSPAWEARKAWWRSLTRDDRRRCRACHAPPPYDLHHRTYRRLGSERRRDLVPLCRRHHDALGVLQRSRGWTVERTTTVFLVAAAICRAARKGLVAVVVVSTLTLAVILVR